jgi:hypothetical protein
LKEEVCKRNVELDLGYIGKSKNVSPRPDGWNMAELFVHLTKFPIEIIQDKYSNKIKELMNKMLNNRHNHVNCRSWDQTACRLSQNLDLRRLIPFPLWNRQGSLTDLM